MARSFWFESGAEALIKMGKILIKYGDQVSPRGITTYELRNVVIEIGNPTDVLCHGINRKMNDGIAAIEALQLIGGFSDPQLVATIAPNFRNFMDTPNYFHGAYGPRLRMQLPKVIERLQRDGYTRQAIATIWDPLHDLFIDGSKDYPCTTYLSFLIRNGALEMTTHMRSNDIWWGWTYDVVQFTMLQNTIARFLQLPTGSYTHYVDSLHIYERDIPAFSELTALDPAESRQPLEGLPMAGGIRTYPWQEVQAFAEDIAHNPQLYVSHPDMTVSWLANSIADRL